MICGGGDFGVQIKCSRNIRLLELNNPLSFLLVLQNASGIFFVSIPPFGYLIVSSFIVRLKL